MAASFTPIPPGKEEAMPAVPDSKSMVMAAGIVIGAGASRCTKNHNTRASFAQTSAEIKVAGSKP